MTDSRPLKLTYVVSKWNQATETFVRREVAAAVADGTSVQVLSLRKPGPSDGIVDHGSLQRVLYPDARRLAGRLIAGIVRNPVRSARSLATIVRYSRAATVLPHLKAWAVAVSVTNALERSDVVIAHFAWLSATSAHVLAQMQSTPLVIFCHAHDIYEDKCRDEYLGVRLRAADEVFVESGAIARDVRELYAAIPTVVRVGVPEAFVKTSADTPGASRSAPLIASVGALREKKGHDVLIRATERIDGVRVKIAGEGPERARLEALISTLGVGDRVELLGHVELAGIRPLLDEADVFCLASRLVSGGDRDGVPNVLIEAMARAKPVVSTNVSGIPDLLGTDRGIMVPADDERALEAAIRRMLDDREFASGCAWRARDEIRARYTTEANWAMIAGVLRSVADQR